VDEVGLISARVAPAEVEASVLPSRPQEAARPPVRAHLRRSLPVPIQVGVTLGATAIAFKASLLSLATGFPGQVALGALGFVPLISLLLTLGIAIRGQRPEPDIHDRYLDYILGLALLGGATAAMWFLPGSMSVFFWSWRLDLVWLPVFVAGVLTLESGARALWRYRVPIIFLFLAWPLPYVVARIPGGVSAAAIAGLGLVLLAVVLLSRRRRSRARLSLPSPARGGGQGGGRVGGGLVAAMLVCGAAILTTVADRQLEAVTPLLEADGQPRLAATSKPPTSVEALSRVAASDSPNLPSWGSAAGRRTYRYVRSQATLPGTGDPSVAGIVVNVMAPGDGRVLALSPAALAVLQGYRLDVSRVEDLGGSVAAHVERYVAPGERMALLVVWWDWPVRSAAGAQRERIIVQRLVPLDGRALRDDELLHFARRLAASMIGEASAAP
jgi:hypothetical protein